MLHKIKPKSEFGRNVLTLMSGTVVAQAIPIAITPILTRLYTPEEFGLFALFFSILAIFSVVANGRYESAVMLPKKDEEAINIFALGIVINTTLSISLLVIVIIFNDEITHLLGNEEISIWLYFVPVSLFFTGLFNILTSFNNRQKNYRDMADALIIKSLVMSSIQIIIGLLKSGVTGLISGQIFSQLFANMRLLKNIIKDKALVSSITIAQIKHLGKRYKKFPQFSLPSALANVLSGHLSNILISSFFSVTTLGLYSLVQRILGVPSALIGKSISMVYYEEGTKEKSQTGSAIKIFNSTLKKLIVIGIPFFGTLFFIVEDLFVFVFSEEWRVAGHYAQIVIPMFLISFVVSSLSATYDMFEALKIELLWQVMLLIGSVFLVVLSHLLSLEFQTLLILLTTYISIMQLVSLYIIRKILLGKVIN